MNRLLACLLVLPLGPAALAAEPPYDAPDRGWYVAPGLTYTRADAARGAGNGPGAVLTLGNRGEVAAMELSGLYTRLGDGATLAGGEIGVRVGPFGSSWWSRFVGLVGFGLLQEKNVPALGKDGTSIFGDAGFGYVYPLPLFGWASTLRADLRYRYDYEQPPHDAGTPESFGDWILGVGLQIPLWHTVRVPPPADARVAVVPATAPPAVPEPAPVEAAPAPAPAADLAQAGTLVLQGVNFQTGRAELTPDSIPVLDDAAKQLVAHADLKVEVGGHTDSSGNAASNLTLSQQRAEAVRDYLIGQGVAADRLSAKGYGDAVPLADNATAAGRARNRRVELKVLP